MTTLPSPDNLAALDFLRKMYPDGPWVLTSIRTDRRGIQTRTFSPNSEGACLDWLKTYNGARNIYFGVNPPLRALSKKAEREDIKEVVYLHVDIDPRTNEDLEAERKRIEASLTTNHPPGVPAPTVVLFSGGGYQAFWKLEAPITIGGDLQLAEDAKRYNQQLELVFGGDNCHNIDRIIRLPGTINVPDAKKLKKGRVPTVAKLKWFRAAARVSAFCVHAAARASGNVCGALRRNRHIERYPPWRHQRARQVGGTRSGEGHLPAGEASGRASKAQ